MFMDERRLQMLLITPGSHGTESSPSYAALLAVSFLLSTPSLSPLSSYHPYRRVDQTSIVALGFNPLVSVVD